MEREKLRNVALVNELTGEKYDIFLAKRRWTGSKWVKTFQDGKAELLQRGAPFLHGQSYRVLSYLDTVVAWGNIIPSPSALTERLGLNKAAVYRAYAELTRANFIIKRDKVYYLSPFYCWKGSQRELERACHELIAPMQMQALPDKLKD